MEPEPKIEREKIRRPPSRDSRPAEAATSSGTAFQPAHDDGGDYHDSAHEDWTLERGGSSTWDDDSESDWVLEPDLEDDSEAFVDEEFVEADEEEVVDDYIEDDAGVVWEDDGLPDEMAFDNSGQMVIEDGEDITFDDHDTGFGAAPEVELAGRRDVSPRSPRQAPSPRSANARQATPTRAPRKQAQKQRKPRQQQTARQPLAQWEAPDQPADQAEPPGPAPLEPTPRPAPVSKARPAPRPVEIEPVSRPHSQPAGDVLPSARGRSTTRSPAEALVIGDAPAQPLPQHSGGAAGRRRRQSAQKPRLAIPQSGHRSSSGRRKRSGKGLLPPITVVVVGIFGWFGYQQIDPATIQPTLDRITSLLPFPASTRTAEDSSFGDQEALENLTAEQALSYLEDRALSQSDAPAAADRINGPPIPKFKPLANDGASSAATRSAATSGNDEGAAQDASIIEQIIRYINPG